MSDVAQIKATLIVAAYEAAAAALENSTPVLADPTVQDPGLRTRNLAIYEVAKVHYAALLSAFQDKTGIWPDPKLDAPATATAPAPQGAAIPAPGHDVAKVVADVANAIAPAVPAAGVVGQVAGAVSNALGQTGK